MLLVYLRCVKHALLNGGDAMKTGTLLGLISSLVGTIAGAYCAINAATINYFAGFSSATDSSLGIDLAIIATVVGLSCAFIGWGHKAYRDYLNLNHHD